MRWISDATLEWVSPESPEGLDILRHSTAHLMAQAVQDLFPGTQVTIGPTIENGFYYDFKRSEPFSPEELERIEKRMQELVKADLKVVREELPRGEAIELFRSMGENYKVEIIEGIPDETVSLYRQGDWVDLCRGPHVPSTAATQSFQADQRRRCLLAGRLAQRTTAAHLWHGMGKSKGFGCLPEAGRRGQATRPPPAWAGPGFVLAPSDRAGLAVFSSQGRRSFIIG